MVPATKLDPPAEAEYQLMVPAEAAALKATVPVPQRLPGVVEVKLAIGITVATTAVLAAVVHPFKVAST